MSSPNYRMHGVLYNFGLVLNNNFPPIEGLILAFCCKRRGKTRKEYNYWFSNMWQTKNMVIMLHAFISIHLLVYKISYITFIAITNSAKIELDAKK